ncbi:MAG: SpoVA/SpoVAEb family sporulation membrane protein [Oscillospiraceae bacterium]|jgi:stage V sporulation protein AE|nr:SpoVA/SpoVAEb family sporulation membrane protein [Oscillospiraceae bacterium]
MNIIWSLLKAFLVGGAICFLSQLLLDYTKLTMARILVLLVVAGAVLGAVGLYEPFAEWAGAGATVPLSGFGFAMVRGVKKAVGELGWPGILTGPFSAASAGTGLAVFCGLLAALATKPREK